MRQLGGVGGQLLSGLFIKIVKGRIMKESYFATSLLCLSYVSLCLDSVSLWCTVETYNDKHAIIVKSYCLLTGQCSLIHKHKPEAITRTSKGLLQDRNNVG